MGSALDTKKVLILVEKQPVFKGEGQIRKSYVFATGRSLFQHSDGD
jgi:hypothetical protein